MQTTETLLDIYQKRGSKGLPLERVYRHLFDPELYLQAYGRIYRNFGSMTKGTTMETVDGMDLQRVHNIIGLLKMERYKWTPVRRVEIPKSNGKTRPLGIPTFSDKLIQEVLRTMLEPYYEQKFSDQSHGFRPNRSCHTALREIRRTWKGTVWFIEGDIKGCFDNIDHEILLSILRRDIHDGRLIQLIANLLKAGYMEDWKYYDTFSGTPQGGIISPFLANIYLNELDKFVTTTLIPTHTLGQRRQPNPAYVLIDQQLAHVRRRNDLPEIKRLIQERRQLMSVDPCDPNYRRLRYIRYADDFLLGFAGPKKEAEVIRQELGEFLEQQLKLQLSLEKTIITHASDDKASFLGYELTIIRKGHLIFENGKRAANGNIALLVPRKVVQKYLKLFSNKGKIRHRSDLIDDTDYTILQRYQSVLQGLYNYYCMAQNVGQRMNQLKRILEISLTKTLARKYQCHVMAIYKRYQVPDSNPRKLQVTIERPEKPALISTFGGIPFTRKPEGLGTKDFRQWLLWYLPGSKRSEVVQRLLVGKCELCDRNDLPTVVHHIHKLADIDRPGRRPKADWEKVMAARKRKSLVVCTHCHWKIHAGKHDGQAL